MRFFKKGIVEITVETVMDFVWHCPAKQGSGGLVMNIDENTVRKTCERFNIEGHAHELTFSCYHRTSLLSNAYACDLLVEAIERAKRKHVFALWAYVFMPDHVHLLIKPRKKNYSIAAILQSIKQPVAQKYFSFKKHCPASQDSATRQINR